MRRRAASLGLVALSVALTVLAACGSSKTDGKTPSGARASGAADSDCVVTDQSNCCAPCKARPFAMPMLAFEQQENRCSLVDCAPTSERIECPAVPPKSEFSAKCKDGTCAAVQR